MLCGGDAGDVLLHTITDAILGALCLPDIGERPRGAAGALLLLMAVHACG